VGANPAWHPREPEIGNDRACCKPARLRMAPPDRYIASMSVPLSAALDPGPEPDRADILVVPHPSLKQPARKVLPADADAVRALLPRMWAAMYAAPGIGLAAPQVGSRLRLAVVDLMPNHRGAPMTLVNPEVVAQSTGLATREEGCLSLPGMYADVTRPATVRVRYTDAGGARQEIQADGLLAACLQHEIDHLDGILFTDHLSILKRNMILRRLAKELRQKA